MSKKKSVRAARVPDDLVGVHVVVTGGSRGIGFAIARGLVTAGARVSLIGLNRVRLRQAAQLLESSSHFPVSFHVLNVSEPRSVGRVFRRLSQSEGGVGVLVNCAGAVETGPVGQTSLSAWERMLATNLTGTFLCSQAVLDGMTAAGWGRIVNIASTAGVKGYPYVAAYCAAKHGVVGLTRAMALEVASLGVTVNAVCPGYSPTDLLLGSLAKVAEKTGRSVKALRAELERTVPIRRFVRPEEVARMVVWLCGPESGATTGQTFVIDGGELAR